MWTTLIFLSTLPSEVASCRCSSHRSCLYQFVLLPARTVYIFIALCRSHFDIRLRLREIFLSAILASSSSFKERARRRRKGTMGAELDRD